MFFTNFLLGVLFILAIISILTILFNNHYIFIFFLKGLTLYKPQLLATPICSLYTHSLFYNGINFYGEDQLSKDIELPHVRIQIMDK